MKRSYFGCVLVLLCFLAGSCKYAAYAIYGVKNPRHVRSEKKLRSFWVDTGMDTTRLFSVDYPSYPTILAQLEGYPDFMVFDASGRYLPYAPEGEWICKGTIGNFLETLGDTAYPQPEPSDRFLLADQLTRLRSLTGATIDQEQLPEADYYVDFPTVISEIEGNEYESVTILPDQYQYVQDIIEYTKGTQTITSYGYIEVNVTVN